MLVLEILVFLLFSTSQTTKLCIQKFNLIFSGLGSDLRKNLN